MKPTRLILQGLTCFDEGIDLDLSTLPSGLIAVVGPTGSGKTTIMEAMCPGALFRRMPTRPDRRGLLGIATRRDALLQLDLEHKGEAWTLIHQLDPDANNGAGKALAFVERNGELLTEGRVGDFDEVIAKCFPARSVILASAYAAQGGVGSFPSLPRAERRDLFGQLLGLGHLQDLAVRARQQRIEAEQQLGSLSTEIAAMEEASARADKLRTNVAELRAGDNTAARETAQAALDEALATVARLEAAGAPASDSAPLVARVKDLTARKARAVAELLDARAACAPATVEALQEQVARAKALEIERNEVLARNQAARAARAALVPALTRMQERVATTASNLEAARKAMTHVDVSDTATTVADARRELEAADAAEAPIRRARNAAIIPVGTRPPEMVIAELDSARSARDQGGTVPCNGAVLYYGGAPRSDGDPAAGEVDCSECPLLEQAIAAREFVPLLEAELQTTTKIHYDYDAASIALDRASRRADLARRAVVGAEHRATFTTELDACQAAHDEATDELDKLVTEDQLHNVTAETLARSGALAAELQALSDLPAQLEAVERARELVPRIETDLATCSADLDDAQHELQALAAVDTPQGLDETRARLQTVRAELAELHGALQERTTMIARCEGQLIEIGDPVARIEAIEARRAAVEERIRIQGMLETALGREGLQALEIDAAGPEVSRIAGELLSASYGARFAVELRTVRAARSGAQLETLDLIVHDGRDGSARTFDELSAGEKALVDEALKLAIAVFCASRDGGVSTLWRDEVDGSLDPTRRRRHPTMLRAALEIGGFDQLFFVSHDPDVHAQADARIVIEDGAARIEL